MAIVMRVCCVGKSHTEFQIVAVLASEEDAQVFMKKEAQTVKHRHLVGFIAPWIVDGARSEQLGLDFVWDERLKPPPYKPKKAVY